MDKMMYKKECTTILKDFSAIAVFFAGLLVSSELIDSRTLQYVVALGMFLFYLTIESKLLPYDFFVWSDTVSKKKETLILFIVAASALFVVYNSGNMLGADNYKIVPQMFVVSLIATISCNSIAKKKNNKFLHSSKNTLYSIIIICLTSWFYYMPYSILNYKLINFEAYWHNVVSFYEGNTFSMANTSYYGHYALLMILFFRIFGLSLRTIEITQAIGVAIILILLFLTVDIVSKESEVNRVISKWLIIGYFCLEGTRMLYPQGTPHRWVLVSVIIFLSTLYIYNYRREDVIIIYLRVLINLVCVIGLMWNFEMGIAATVAWATIKGVVDTEEQPKEITIIKQIIITTMLSVSASWIVVALINKLSKGYFISFKTYIFPLGSDYVKGLESPANWRNIVWIAILIIFLLTAELSYRCWKGNRQNENSVARLFFAILGLLLFPYFFNRAAIGNLVFVSFFPLVFLWLIECKMFDKNCSLHNTLKLIGLFCAILLTIFGLAGAAYNPPIASDIRNKESFEAFTEKINGSLPQNAIMYGEGASFYSLIVNGSKVFPFDCVNVSNKGFEKTKEFFMNNSKKKIIITGDSDYIDKYICYWTGIKIDELTEKYEFKEKRIKYNERTICFTVLSPKENSITR